MTLDKTSLPSRQIVNVLRVEKRGSRTVIGGNLIGFLFKERNTWVAYCQSLDLSSCGDTEEKALESVGEAIKLWFDSCIMRGTLELALSELGWVYQRPNGQLADCSKQRLPPAYVIEAMARTGKDWSQPIRFETGCE